MSDGTVRLFFGKTKSGKSFLANKMLKKRSKSIVYDYAHTFTGTIINDFSIANFSKLIKKYGGRKNIKSKYRLIFRKPSNMTHQNALDMVALLARKIGETYGKRSLPENDLITFVIDEADKCSTKKDNDKVRLAVQAGRHDNLSTWAISQRPTRLHPDFRYNASEVFAFKLTSEDKFYKEIFSPQMLKLINNLEKYSFALWCDDGKQQIISKKGKVKNDLSI